MKVLIGTKNHCKIKGAKIALENYFDNVEIEGIGVSSNVNEEPLNEEIYIGAKNRVDNLIKYAKENNLKIDYYMGIESGITKLFGNWIIINVAVIKDKNGYESIGTSSGFPVPNKYVEEIINTDLGKVMDKIFNEKNLRSNNGGISLLTHNKINRIDLTRDAFIMALTKFINNGIWRD